MPHKSKPPTTTDSPERFSLSTRGYATVALCPGPAYVTALDGSWDRLSSERAQWAYAHGLQPVDGAYLRELSRRPLTLTQLGEALAVFSQTTQMVALAMEQLHGLGLIEAVKDDTVEGSEPREQAIQTELTAALDDLQLLLASVEKEDLLDRRTAGVTLRRAMSRVVAARRFAQVTRDPESVDEPTRARAPSEPETD